MTQTERIDARILYLKEKRAEIAGGVDHNIVTLTKCKNLDQRILEAIFLRNEFNEQNQPTK